MNVIDQQWIRCVSRDGGDGGDGTNKIIINKILVLRYPLLWHIVVPYPLYAFT